MTSSSRLIAVPGSNDRLLLGLPGTVSEFEQFAMRNRLYRGRLTNAELGGVVLPVADDGEICPCSGRAQEMAAVADLIVARQQGRSLAGQGVAAATRIRPTSPTPQGSAAKIRWYNRMFSIGSPTLGQPL